MRRSENVPLPINRGKARKSRSHATDKTEKNPPQKTRPIRMVASARDILRTRKNAEPSQREKPHPHERPTSAQEKPPPKERRSAAAGRQKKRRSYTNRRRSEERKMRGRGRRSRAGTSESKRRHQIPTPSAKKASALSHKFTQPKSQRKGSDRKNSIFTAFLQTNSLQKRANVH